MDGSASGGGGAILVAILVIVVFSGLWLWSLIHCAMNKRLNDSNRIIGIVLIVLLGLLGSLIYLFLPRTAARSRYGSRSTSRLQRGRGQPSRGGQPQRGTRSFGAGGRPMARSRR